jgi:hypothetical protein
MHKSHDLQRRLNCRICTDSGRNRPDRPACQSFRVPGARVWNAGTARWLSRCPAALGRPVLICMATFIIPHGARQGDPVAPNSQDSAQRARIVHAAEAGLECPGMEPCEPLRGRSTFQVPGFGTPERPAGCAVAIGPRGPSNWLTHAGAWVSVMFEKAEMDAELHARLKSAGINPLDPDVQAINSVVSAYYAEKTAKVLQQVQEVLDKLAPN